MSILRLITPDSPTRDVILSDYAGGVEIAPKLVRDDAAMAFSVEPVIQNDDGSISPDHLSSDTYEVAIGQADKAPTGGTFKLAVNASSTNLTALAYNIAATALQTPLSAAFVAAGKSANTVSLIATGVYKVVATSNGAVTTGYLTSDATNLIPDCNITITEKSLGSSTSPYHYIIAIQQADVCYATPTAQLAPAIVAVSTTQSGSSTANKIQKVDFAAPITTSSVANPSVITTSVNHGFATGNLVRISGHTGSSPDINGVYAVTYISATTFSIPVNVTTGGTLGSVRGAFSDVYGGSYSVSASAPSTSATIATSSVANPSVITTSAAHGFATGDQVTIAGHSGSTPSINSTYTITVVSGTTFSIPVNVTVGGTGGTVTKQVSTTCGIATPNMTEVEFANLLAVHALIYFQEADGTADNIRVTRIGTAYQVEFIGTLGQSNSPALTVTNVDLVVPKGVSGTIDLNTVSNYISSLEETDDSFTRTFAVKRTRSTGEKKTLLSIPITMLKSIFTAGLVPTPMNVLLPRRLTAAFSKTNSTLADITDLTVPILANQSLRLEYLLKLTDAGGVQNWQVALSLPSGATNVMVLRYAGTTDPANFKIATTLPAMGDGFLDADDSVAVAKISTEIANGSTAGNVILQFAQISTDGVSPCTVAAGSSVVPFALP